MPGVIVDGMDVVAVYEAARVAVARARNGEGPSMIECKTYRYYDHAGVRDWEEHTDQMKKSKSGWNETQSNSLKPSSQKQK
ncbi:MAG: hypothetical protein Ct9H90mP5_03710 [Acidimicrobiaceae bacterium]|nr:MAG: hypothetical protein Ct9H90mP5_03710 [Acidimicrobiaceae bacterium]